MSFGRDDELAVRSCFSPSTTHAQVLGKPGGEDGVDSFLERERHGDDDEFEAGWEMGREGR